MENLNFKIHERPGGSTCTWHIDASNLSLPGSWRLILLSLHNQNCARKTTLTL